MKRLCILNFNSILRLARSTRVTQLLLFSLLALGVSTSTLAYSPEDLAGHTLTGITLSENQLQFEDRGLIRETITHYQILVQDKNSGAVIFKNEFQPKTGARQIHIPLGTSIRSDHDHLIRISVKREGRNLSAPLSFEKETHQLAQLNPASYADQERISAFSMGSQILFTDATPNDGKVETRYRVKLQKRVLNILWESTIAEAEFNRKDVALQQSNTVKLPISAFGVKPEDVSSIQIEVTRISPRLKGASPIRFEKKMKI